MENLKYFKMSFIITFIGIILGYYVGGYEALIIVMILAVLEVSLSFDNAVVNATVLRDMDEKWRKRFLTWGILIAVLGMRILFPLIIVGVTANINPIDAFTLAINDPKQYSIEIQEAHYLISGFGASFLMMVGLKFFFDEEKDVHWVSIIEKPLIKIGKLESIEIGLVFIIVFVLSKYLPIDHALEFVISSIIGIITYIIVDGFGSYMEQKEEENAKKRHSVTEPVKSGLALFLYLEVLDSSFSLDGVIGAFTISNNLFIIAIGLGIGAIFVRSLTIMLVEKGTLAEYIFLEHGAFYAIIALASIMYLKTIIYIPELITGFIGATFIIISVISSIIYRRKNV